MTITLHCPGCTTRLTFGNDRAGTSFSCPRCTSAIHVPLASPSPAPARARGCRNLTDWTELNDALDNAEELLLGTLKTSEEESMREALTEYADTIPHHELSELGNDIVNLTLFHVVRAYSLRLRSLYEQRHAKREEEPWTGESCPPPTIDEKSIRIWDYQYPALPSEFRPITQSHRVNESQELRICSRCNGRKWTFCLLCSGSGGVTCASCHGSREEVCPRATDDVTHPYTGMGKRRY